MWLAGLGCAALCCVVLGDEDWMEEGEGAGFPEGRRVRRRRTAPQLEQVLEDWPAAPHLGHSVPCMLDGLG